MDETTVYYPMGDNIIEILARSREYLVSSPPLLSEVDELLSLYIQLNKVSVQKALREALPKESNLRPIK